MFHPAVARRSKIAPLATSGGREPGRGKNSEDTFYRHATLEKACCGKVTEIKSLLLPKNGEKAYFGCASKSLIPFHFKVDTDGGREQGARGQGAGSRGERIRDQLFVSDIS